MDTPQIEQDLGTENRKAFFEQRKEALKQQYAGELNNREMTEDSLDEQLAEVDARAEEQKAAIRDANQRNLAQHDRNLQRLAEAYDKVVEKSSSL